MTTDELIAGAAPDSILGLAREMKRLADKITGGHRQVVRFTHKDDHYRASIAGGRVVELHQIHPCNRYVLVGINARQYHELCREALEALRSEVVS